MAKSIDVVDPGDRETGAGMRNAVPRVLRLAKNASGRDFIIGDVHGAFDLVWEGMKAVGFDRSVDRLLSVGDLIDRGAGSYRCLDFLAQPYVYAVPGNHEWMLVDAWRQNQLDRDVIDALANMNFNGMRWMKDVPVERLQEMAAQFEQLPFVIEVETDRGLVGLLHADVPEGMDWQTFTAKIESGDDVATRMALGLDIGDDSHESRRRIRTERTDGVSGIGRVFVGHTVLFGGLKKLGNVYAVDTGATFGEAGKGKGHLTVVNPLMATGVLTAPPEKTNPLLDLRFVGEIPSRPFHGVGANMKTSELQAGDSSRLLVLPVTCDDAFADRPFAAIVQWTPEFDERIAALRKTVVDSHLEWAGVRIDAVFPDGVPEDEEEKEEGLQVLGNALHDEAMGILVDPDHPVGKVLAGLDDMASIGDIHLVVTPHSWSLTCKNDGSGVQFESLQVFIDQPENSLVEFDTVLAQRAAEAPQAPTRNTSPSP